MEKPPVALLLKHLTVKINRGVAATASGLTIYWIPLRIASGFTFSLFFFVVSNGALGVAY